MSVTHADLVERAARWLRNTRRCALVGSEKMCAAAIQSPDGIGWLAEGRCIHVECKTSRADLAADHRKLSRKLANGDAAASWVVGHERWYMAPVDVLPVASIPEGWGLLELRGDRVYRKLQAQCDEREGMSMAEARLLVHVARHAGSGYPNVTVAPVDEPDLFFAPDAGRE